jgi:hypothetical protein
LNQKVQTRAKKVKESKIVFSEWGINSVLQFDVEVRYVKRQNVEKITENVEIRLTPPDSPPQVISK